MNPAISWVKNNVLIVLLTIVLGLSFTVGLSAQSKNPDQSDQFGQFDDWPEERGDPAVAEKYLLWAEDAIAAGRWAQARAALERAVDFADVSSDISYLLALARSQENEDRRLVLASLERAIGTRRWRYYTEAQARLLEADQLITLRRYFSALNTLAVYKTIAGENADMALLRLAALKGLTLNRDSSGEKLTPGLIGLPVPAEFRRRMLETLDRYPRDPRPLRMLLNYARGGNLDRDNSALVEVALRRLPFLLEADPELAWMAAPFINNDAEARRLVAAYRAGSLKSRPEAGFRPHPASLIPALNLGLLDDIDAVDDLFTETILEREVIVHVGNLLRSEEGRDHLVRRLHSFTGAITDDEDGDGYAESRAVYRQGNLQEYYCDTDQDGITDLFISFNAGTPQRAELATLPAFLPMQKNGRAEALIVWERYPAVQRAVLENENYLPAPGGFQFAPVNFVELGATDNYAGLLFPRRDSFGPGISRRMLALFAASVQRPSAEFEGGVEQVFLERGIPFRAEVTLNGMVVSVTEFENGYPLVQRLDLDMDGRMETVRRFRKTASGGQSVLQSSESDWNGGGVFSTAERYREDGSSIYSWDLDGDGKREYEK
ncbi:MAG: hypothetical protein LBH20_06695 [Treponema sp.]|jgi:hypothetical protein|nr:hypothetical protein [Treponema sp.]